MVQEDRFQPQQFFMLRMPGPSRLRCEFECLTADLRHRRGNLSFSFNLFVNLLCWSWLEVRAMKRPPPATAAAAAFAGRNRQIQTEPSAAQLASCEASPSNTILYMLSLCPPVSTRRQELTPAVDQIRNVQSLEADASMSVFSHRYRHTPSLCPRSVARGSIAVRSVDLLLPVVALIAP